MAAKKSRKKFLIIGSAAVLAIGGAGLYAGALTVNNSGNIGAGSTAVAASCDSTVTATAGAASWDTNAYKYSTVDVSGIDATACAGQDITITVIDNLGATVTTGSLSNIDTATETVTLAAGVSAALEGASYQVLIQS